MEEPSDSSAEDVQAGTARVPCGVCQREIPVSAAISAEATDYVAHFCGLECYDRWRHQAGSATCGPSHG